MTTSPRFKAGKMAGVNLTRKDDSAQHPIGTHVHSAEGNPDDGGGCYRYVKFIDAVTYVVGHLCTAAGILWQVTNDRSGGTAEAGLWPIGFLVGDVPAENDFGWVQCGGIITDAVMGSNSVIAGDLLKPDATEDGDIEEAIAGTDENICAVAQATIADNAAGRVLAAIRH